MAVPPRAHTCTKQTRCKDDHPRKFTPGPQSRRTITVVPTKRSTQHPYSVPTMDPDLRVDHASLQAQGSGPQGSAKYHTAQQTIWTLETKCWPPVWQSLPHGRLTAGNYRMYDLMGKSDSTSTFGLRKSKMPSLHDILPVNPIRFQYFYLSFRVRLSASHRMIVFNAVAFTGLALWATSTLTSTLVIAFITGLFLRRSFFCFFLARIDMLLGAFC